MIIFMCRNASHSFEYKYKLKYKKHFLRVEYKNFLTTKRTTLWVCQLPEWVVMVCIRWMVVHSCCMAWMEIVRDCMMYVCVCVWERASEIAVCACRLFVCVWALAQYSSMCAVSDRDHWQYSMNVRQAEAREWTSLFFSMCFKKLVHRRSMHSFSLAFVCWMCVSVYDWCSHWDCLELNSRPTA